MKDLKFNIYAMSNPTSLEDYVLLLDEALSELESLNRQFLEIERLLIIDLSKKT
jgi:hypothetical protein